MKITRLKRGYRISLSDSEFAALSFLIQHGQCDMEGVDPEDWGVIGKPRDHLMNGRLGMINALVVDEDRR